MAGCIVVRQVRRNPKFYTKHQSSFRIFLPGSEPKGMFDDFLHKGCVEMDISQRVIFASEASLDLSPNCCEGRKVTSHSLVAAGKRMRAWRKLRFVKRSRLFSNLEIASVAWNISTHYISKPGMSKQSEESTSELKTSRHTRRRGLLRRSFARWVRAHPNIALRLSTLSVIHKKRMRAMHPSPASQPAPREHH